LFVILARGCRAKNPDLFAESLRAGEPFFLQQPGSRILNRAQKMRAE
jgi:hypothetical protein